MTADVFLITVAMRMLRVTAAMMLKINTHGLSNLLKSGTPSCKKQAHHNRIAVGAEK